MEKLAKQQSDGAVGSPHPTKAELQAKLERVRNGFGHPQESVRPRQSVPLVQDPLATAVQTSAISPLLPAHPPVTAAKTGATSPDSILLVPPTSELGRHKVHVTGSSTEIFDPKKSWGAASRQVRMGLRAVDGFKVRMLSHVIAQYSFPTVDHWNSELMMAAAVYRFHSLCPAGCESDQF